MIYLKAMLIIVGVVWCKEILQRLPKDIKTFGSSKERSEQAVIVLLWSATIYIMTLIGKSIWNLVDLFS